MLSKYRLKSVPIVLESTVSCVYTQSSGQKEAALLFLVCRHTENHGRVSIGPSSLKVSVLPELTLKGVHVSNPESLLGPQSFTMTQKLESTVLSMCGFSRLQKSNYAKTFNTCTSFYKLKTNSCKFQGIGLNSHLTCQMALFIK